MTVDDWYKKLLPSTIRSQLILGIALINIVLMSLFVWQQTDSRKYFLVKQNRDRAIGLSSNLAHAANSYVISYELAGLQKLVESYQHIPDINYAFVISEDGTVLSHTNETYIGMKASDSISNGLKPTNQTQILIETNSVLDIATPILHEGEIIGWARIGLSQEYIQSNLKDIEHKGFLYILIGLLVGSAFAIVVANRLSLSLQKLLEAAGKITEGNRELRVGIPKNLEIAQLGTAFNQMLDDISSNEKLLGMVLENMPVGVWILDENNKVTLVNPAGESMWKGTEDAKREGYHIYKGWFTETGKEVQPHEWGATIAISEGRSVLNQEIEIECADKSHKIILNSAIPLFDANEKIIGGITINVDITERKKAEQKIKQNEETTRHIMNSALDAIVGMDQKGNIMMWTQQAERIFGWKAAAVLGKKMSTVIVPERYRQNHERGLARYLETGTSTIMNRPIELSALHQNGSEFSIELSIVKVVGGEDDFFCAFIRDITERKKATELFKYQFDNSPDIIIIINKDLIIESINKGRPNGPTAGELVGKNCIEILPVESQQISLDCITRCFETGTNQEIENMLTGNRWVRSRFVPMLIDGIITHVMVIATDVTERKVAIENLKQSEEKNRALVENIEDTIILLDGKGEILYKNPGYSRTSGFSMEDLKNKNVFDMIHPQDQQDAHNLFKRTLEQPGVPLQTKYRVLRKDGDYCWAEGSIINLLDNPSVKGIIINYRDISERIKFEDDQKQMEREREKTMTELLQRNRDLEQFSYVVSHNLRGPVATMMGLSEMIQSGQLNPSEKEQLVQGVSESAKKLETVVQDLNTILEVKHALNTEKEKVIFDDLLYEVKASLYSLIVNENVQFNCDFSLATELTTIKSYLFSIFYNLVSNSIKYRQPGIQPMVEITGKKEGTKTILHFKDNGLGMDLQKTGIDIFGLYERFHFHIEGKGLGLYMVKTQVEALGGKITVHSKEKVGTEFTIVFEA